MSRIYMILGFNFTSSYLYYRQIYPMLNRLGQQSYLTDIFPQICSRSVRSYHVHWVGLAHFEKSKPLVKHHTQSWGLNSFRWNEFSWNALCLHLSYNGLQVLVRTELYFPSSVYFRLIPTFLLCGVNLSIHRWSKDLNIRI